MDLERIEEKSMRGGGAGGGLGWGVSILNVFQLTSISVEYS